MVISLQDLPDNIMMPLSAIGRRVVCYSPIIDLYPNVWYESSVSSAKAFVRNRTTGLLWSFCSLLGDCQRQSSLKLEPTPPRPRSLSPSRFYIIIGGMPPKVRCVDTAPFKTVDQRRCVNVRRRSGTSVPLGRVGIIPFEATHDLHSRVW